MLSGLFFVLSNKNGLCIDPKGEIFMFSSRNLELRKMVVLAMLSAVAFVLVATIRIPVVAFLSYEPKDVAIAMGGFIFGPLAALLMSVVVSLVEMVTVSADGFYGLLMNIIATCSFVCTAAFIYKRKRTLAGAVIGLIAGIAVNVPVMLLWNYLVVPLYLGAPREAVAGMLVPIFLPFNLVKGALNAAFIMILYKPLITALRKTGVLSQTSQQNQEQTGLNSSIKKYLGIILVAGFVILTCVLYVVTVLRG